MQTLKQWIADQDPLAIIGIIMAFVVVIVAFFSDLRDDDDDD